MLIKQHMIEIKLIELIELIDLCKSTKSETLKHQISVFWSCISKYINQNHTMILIYSEEMQPYSTQVY